MFKDDRMISILSGIVLMLAIGTLVQRQEMVAEFLDGEPQPIALRPDSISVMPDTLTRVDVLDNDEGVGRSDSERLIALSQPNCGRVFVQDGAIQFLAERDCEASQTFTYGLDGAEEGTEPGLVTVTVQGATGTRNAPEPSSSPKVAELAPSTAAPSSAPARPSGVIAPQSARRELPSVNAPRVAATPSVSENSAPSRPAARAPRPSAPGLTSPQAPGRVGVAGAPSAPSLSPPSIGGGAGQAPGSPAAPGGAFGSGLSSGVAGINSSPSAPRPGGAPLSPPSIGGGDAPVIALAPSAPSVPQPGRPGGSVGSSALGGSGIGAPAAPSAPSIARPAQPGVAQPGAPRPSAAQPGVSQPGAPRPAQPGQPGVAESAEPARPATAAPAAPAPISGGDTSVAAVSAPQLSAPSIPGAGGSVSPGALGSGVVGRSGAVRVPQNPSAPSAIGRVATPSIALARVEAPIQAAAPSRDQNAGLDMIAPGSNSDRGSLNLGAQIDSSAGQTVALAEPTQGLGDIRALQESMSLVPLLDTTGPAELSAPTSPDREPGLEVSALDPTQEVLPTEGVAIPDAQQDVSDGIDGIEVARLPVTELACVVPPSVTLDVRPAGETVLLIASPCHADSVAELKYQKMAFGVPIDRSGRGSIKMFGFETSAVAMLSFADGEELDFDVPFTGVQRVERVALSWDDPVLMNLHAFEFGAEEGEDGHIFPGAPRDWSVVRRRGGGYLTSFQPVEGVGEHVQIYTHYIRRGGKSGVVKMYIDFASRSRDQLPDTCGEGRNARPNFTVTRSSRGRLEEPNVQRLGALDCDDVANPEYRLIGAAVRDIIISQR